MITTEGQYWDFTQLVREQIDIAPVEEFVLTNFGREWKYKTFKAGKDEVLQVYNYNTCFTCVGGSSADKKEWRSNFNVFPLENGFIHRGAWNGSNDVYTHPAFICKKNMYYAGHSRGAWITAVMIYRFGGRGVGFGSPKAFRKNVDIKYVNVRNVLDPVTHIVPFFKTVGKVIRYKFAKNPHTKYGDHINRDEVVEWS